MAGEDLKRSQPGGRAPAPGALALVQSFINTHYALDGEHGAEVLASPEALAAWLERYGLRAPRLGAKDVRRAIAVRECLRALARGDPGAPDRLNWAARGAATEIRFTAAGPTFGQAPRSGLDGAIGAILATAAGAMLDGTWERLKVCPGEDCGWAFYDHSRNQSGRWCSMAVCGGRAKARTHYRRRRLALDERSA
jgi:predicted RNA-binding Zn ribbon-like protein